MLYGLYTLDICDHKMSSPITTSHSAIVIYIVGSWTEVLSYSLSYGTLTFVISQGHTYNKHTILLINCSWRTTVIFKQSPLYSNVVFVQSLSCGRRFVTPWTAAHQAFLSFTTSQSFLKLMFPESVILFSHFILYCPPLLLPSVFPSLSWDSLGYLLTTS